MFITLTTRSFLNEWQRLLSKPLIWCHANTPLSIYSEVCIKRHIFVLINKEGFIYYQIICSLSEKSITEKQSLMPRNLLLESTQIIDRQSTQTRRGKYVRTEENANGISTTIRLHHFGSMFRAG